jgi:signal transduction histidine kinase/DNA-binding response OmpR family regulator
MSRPSLMLDTTVLAEYSGPARYPMYPLLSLTLKHDEDVVSARRCAAQLAALFQFDSADQTRIATAVSEIVRNAFRYASGGAVHFELDTDARPQTIHVRIEDGGPGIRDLDGVLAGRFRSSTGMGLGISGARRLVDHFSIDSSPEGTRVVLTKALPDRVPLVTRARAAEIAEALRRRPAQGLMEEVQQQNQELLRALDDLQRKQQELTRLNRELEDTNRGVVALYAELDEKADHLRRADDLKSRFLSNMTHEFRTPVNAIIGLCNLLRDDRERAGLKPEPELEFILKAADQLWTLVSDLLDLATVEAGKTVVRPATFEVQQLFGALRGMLRPLLLNQSVALVFDAAEDLPPLHTDEGKVSQILRNLISNGLKFTERGEVRVSATLDRPAGMITFRVADTGIGIAPEDQETIFEEFGQIEHRLQRRVRGTGLGLPLSRRLAELLGGSLTVESAAGVGSIFSVRLPATFDGGTAANIPVEWTPHPGKLPVLVIEDAPDAQFMYERILNSSQFQPYPARTVAQAEAALGRIAPAAIVLDLVIGGEEAWDLLIRLKRDARTHHVPIVIVSVLAAQRKGLSLGADAFLVKPIEPDTLVETLEGLQPRLQRPIRVLSIDDQEMARYMVHQYLPQPGFEVTDAADAEEGLLRARVDLPDVIVLDLVMPGTSGRDLLADLQGDARTRDIPIVIATGAHLSEGEKNVLRQDASAVLSKEDLSRHTLPGIVRSALRRAI